MQGCHIAYSSGEQVEDRCLSPLTVSTYILCACTSVHKGCKGDVAYMLTCIKHDFGFCLPVAALQRLLFVPKFCIEEQDADLLKFSVLP